MTFELPAVLTSALVAVVLVPLVTYIRDQRVTHSQRAGLLHESVTGCSIPPPTTHGRF